MGKQSSRIIWGRTGEDGNAKTPVEMYDPVETIYVKNNMALVTERVNDQDETRCYICKVIESAGEWETVKNDWRMLQSVSKYDTKKEYKKGAKCIYDGYYWNCTHDITKDDIMRHINDDVLVPTSENYWEHVMQTVAVSYHAMDHKEVFYDDGRNQDKWHKAMWFVPDEDWFDEEHEEEIAEWNPNRQYEHIETKEKGDMIIKTFSYISGEVRKLYECRVRHTTAGDTSWHPEQWREVDDVTEWNHHVAYAKGAYVIRGDIPVGEFIICKFGDLGGTAYFKAGDKCIYYIDRDDKTSLDPDIRREYSALPEWVKTKVENVGTRMSSLYQLKSGVTQPDMNNFQRSEWILIGQAFDLFIGQDYSQGDSVIWNYSAPDPEVGYTIQSVCVFTALENLPALQADQTPTADPSKWGEPWKQVQTAKPQIHLYKAKKNLTPNMNDKWRKENWIICTQMMKTNELDCYGWIWKKLVDPRTHGLSFSFALPCRYNRNIQRTSQALGNELYLYYSTDSVEHFYPYLGGNLLTTGIYKSRYYVHNTYSAAMRTFNMDYGKGSFNRITCGRLYAIGYTAPEGDFWHNSIGHYGENKAYGSASISYSVIASHDGTNWSLIELEHPYLISFGISTVDDGFIYMSCEILNDGETFSDYHISAYKVLLGTDIDGVWKAAETKIYEHQEQINESFFHYSSRAPVNGFLLYYSYSGSYGWFATYFSTIFGNRWNHPDTPDDPPPYQSTRNVGINEEGNYVVFSSNTLYEYLKEEVPEYFDKVFTWSDKIKERPADSALMNFAMHEPSRMLYSNIYGDYLFGIFSVYVYITDVGEKDYPYDPWPGYTEYEWSRYYRGRSYAYLKSQTTVEILSEILWTKNNTSVVIKTLDKTVYDMSKQYLDDHGYTSSYSSVGFYSVQPKYAGLDMYTVNITDAYIGTYGDEASGNLKGYCKLGISTGSFEKLYSNSLLNLLNNSGSIKFLKGKTFNSLGWNFDKLDLRLWGNGYDHDPNVTGQSEDQAYRIYLDVYDSSFLPYFAMGGLATGSNIGRLFSSYYEDRWSNYWDNADLSWFIYIPSLEDHPSLIGSVVWACSGKERSQGIGYGPFYGGDRGDFDEYLMT